MKYSLIFSLTWSGVQMICPWVCLNGILYLISLLALLCFIFWIACHWFFWLINVLWFFYSYFTIKPLYTCRRHALDVRFRTLLCLVFWVYGRFCACTWFALFLCVLRCKLLICVRLFVIMKASLSLQLFWSFMFLCLEMRSLIWFVMTRLKTEMNVNISVHESTSHAFNFHILITFTWFEKLSQDWL